LIEDLVRLIMSGPEEAIEKLKNRVSLRDKGSVLVTEQGELADPTEDRNLKGKKVKPVCHGR